jgi:chemotaxis protein MotB
VVTGSEEEGKVIAILGGGAFPVGREAPSEDLLEAIQNLLPEIVISADSMIVVEGHADSTPARLSREGSVADNKALSLRRSEVVARLLEAEGVDPARISIAGFGDTRPLAPNRTADGRAENRRVEIRLIPARGSGEVRKRKD